MSNGIVNLHGFDARLNARSVPKGVAEWPLPNRDALLILLPQRPAGFGGGRICLPQTDLGIHAGSMPPLDSFLRSYENEKLAFIASEISISVFWNE